MKKVSATLLVAAFAAACAGADTADEAMPDAAPAEPIGTVTITFPQDGAVTGSTFTVTLASTVTIVPAGDATPNSGHHHLLLDTDLTEPGAPIPPTDGAVVHMGDGSAEYTFENVPAGQHRLIAVVADFAHVPLVPLVVDTVTFTVEGN